MTSRIYSIIRTAIILCIVAVSFSAQAQLIIPKRDIQRVDSLNRTRAIEPLTVLKKDYSLISADDGWYRHRHLPSYLADSTDLDSLIADHDWIRLRSTDAVPANIDTMYHDGVAIIGSDTLVRDGEATLQIESLASSPGSALDIYTNADYRHGTRWYNPLIWGGVNPSTFINGVGAFYTSMWVVISAAHSGSGASYTLTHPTLEPFMLGIMGDIPGPCAALRAAGTPGSYNILGMDQDGNTTFKLEGDGTLRWGVDSTAGVDTYLTRIDSAELLTHGKLHVGYPSVVGDGTLNIVGRIDQRYPSTTQHNVAIGENSSAGMTSGDGNVSIGYNSANQMTSASNNVAIGPNTLQANQTGTDNVAIGQDALFSYTGSNNIGLGLWALRSNISGTNNLAFGWKALAANTGSNNTALGNGTLQKNTTGAGNMGIGTNTLAENLTGYDNTAIGYLSMLNVTSPNNVGIGARSLYANNTGYNTALGTDAATNYTGEYSTFTGFSAGSNSSGNRNTLIGAYSGVGMTGGGIAIGYGAGYNNTESNRLFIHNNEGGSMANDKLVSIIYGEMNTTTANQKLHFNSKVLPRYMGGAASSMAGYDASGYLTSISPGDGLELVDGVLDLTGVASDSIIIQEDTICFIIMGDTTCVELDSVFVTDDQICFVDAGDTTCVDYSVEAVTLYTGDGSILQNRNINFNNHFIRIRNNLNFPEFTLAPLASNRFMGLEVATSGAALQNHAIINIVNQSATGTNRNATIRYNVGGYIASTGIDNTAKTFVLSDSLNPYNPVFAYHFTGDSIAFKKDVQLDAGVLDSDGDYGAAGEVLSSTGTLTNWIPLGGATDSVPISQLKPALSARNFDNGNYTQEWKWNTLSDTGLKLSSTSTAAAGNNQKLFESALSGANGTAGQTTYAGYFSNAHSGSTSINYAVYGTSTNGSFNSGVYGNGTYRGVVGNTTSGVGVEAVATSGTALTATATSGKGLSASSTSYRAAEFTINPAGTTDVQIIASLIRGTSNTAANGIGGALTYFVEASDGSGYESNSIVSKWTDATVGSRVSQMAIRGSGGSDDIIFFEDDNRTRFNGRSEEQQGADIASVAGAIALGYDGNVFEITGTNAITLISNLGWQNGSRVTLIFTSTASLVNGTATSGTNITMKLAGAANFNATADDMITLRLTEIGGTQAWREESRSVN